MTEQTEKLEMPLEDFVTAVAKENERLRNILYNSGIIEIAAHNNSVTEYMFHWEGRALEAESKVERLRAALEKIVNGPRDADLDYLDLFVEVKMEARAALEKNQ